jgi:hypothetical protein
VSGLRQIHVRFVQEPDGLVSLVPATGALRPVVCTAAFIASRRNLATAVLHVGRGQAVLGDHSGHRRRPDCCPADPDGRYYPSLAASLRIRSEGSTLSLDNAISSLWSGA